MVDGNLPYADLKNSTRGATSPSTIKIYLEKAKKNETKEKQKRGTHLLRTGAVAAGRRVSRSSVCSMRMFNSRRAIGWSVGRMCNFGSCTGRYLGVG